MANQILLDDYTALASTHWLYMRNRDRWQFLYESYVGGEEYRRAGHLTKYVLETANEYASRLANTPLDNHCQSVISTYISFLFRESPKRELNSLKYNLQAEEFLKDATFEGQSLDNFMKQTSIWASVFGHAWIIMTKPNLGQVTAADEMSLGVRPYVNLLTPLVVSDWRWERMPNGRYDLAYFKYVEEVVDKITVVKEWTKETITTWIMDDVKKEAYVETVEENMLGKIPAVLVYNQRSVVKDLGVSDITDIADVQRQIYNYQSENYEGIRLDGHPSLVVPPTAQLGSGAGAIIQLEDGSDPGLNPYYLESGGTSISNIHASIDKLVEAVDRMSFTSGVRTTKTQSQSGVSLETEFQLLNAKLAEKADQMELAEEQMWKLFCKYQGIIWDGEIEYPDSFNIRDEQREINQLVNAKSAATDPVLLRVIDEQLLELLGEEKERLAYIDINPIPGRTYPDGEAIPESLPPLYIDSADPQVPEGQNCANCEYYKATEAYCIKFDANVRPLFWCAKWEPSEK